MKSYQRFSGLLLILFLISGSLLSQNSPIGNWQGEMALPNGMKINLIFRITEESGNLKAVMDVPSQGAKQIPVDKTEITGDSLKIVVKIINGIYTGKVSETEKTMDGKWVQNGVTLPLKLIKSEKSAELKRPQEPKGPFPYKEEEVNYENRAAGIKLAGTLTLPTGAKKSPAVILISGSGAQNRNEELLGHKPFLVLADYLTRKGIAVLRVDDRGVGGSTGNIREATSEDFAGDVLSGVEFLKGRTEIDPGKIGLIGHSEGGLIAPIAAVKSKDVAFIVLMAGPGLNGEQILYLQARLINKAMGMNDEAASENTKMQETIFKILKEEKNPDSVKIKLCNIYTAGSYNLLEEDQKKPIDARVASVNTKWFRYFLSYDPRPVLEKVKCPLLAMNGEKDLQVPPDENLKLIEEALTKGKNRNFKTVKLPGLNHLFQNCKTGLVAEYGQIEETIAPAALETLGNWITEIVR